MHTSGSTDSDYDGEGHAQILDQVGVAVITIDNNGVIVDTNLSSESMFGLAETDMLGKNVALLMPAHHARKHDGYLQHHLLTGEKRIIGKGRLVEGMRADGTVFPMHLAVGRLEVNNKVYFKGIIHDLSIQDSLQDQATRLGQIVDESVNEIFVFKTDTLRFTLANRGAIANLGYSLDELTQLTPVDFTPAYNEQSFRALVAPLLSGEQERIAYQATHRRKNGGEYDADILLHLSDAVSPPEFVAIVQDCTEKNQMLNTLSQAQKMESIGQLTGGIAHDFNNLLTIISGNLELLDMALTEPQHLELVSEARSASARGADLTHRLLSFARRSRLLPKTLCFNDIVKDIHNLIQRSLGSDVVLKQTLDTTLWNVKADRSQVDSALMNLAINARDAMSGIGTLTISTENLTLPAKQAEALNVLAGDYAVLSVSDTGTGIVEDELLRVFEPFFTTKSESQGSGLGLSMVYGFAQQSGGSVGVKSQPGVGSIFSIYLPRDGSPDGKEKVSGATLPDERRRFTILLVEDDDSVRRLTIRRLKHIGHEVLIARQSAEAISMIEADNTFDLMITDIVMPGDIDGLGLAKILRKDKPHIPIILCSGFSNKLIALGDQERKEFVLLPKPYSMHELESKIATACGDVDRAGSLSKK